MSARSEKQIGNSWKENVVQFVDARKQRGRQSTDNADDFFNHRGNSSARSGKADPRVAHAGGHGFVFEGLNHTSYRVEYTANADCMSHYTLERIVECPERASQLTLADLWERGKGDLGTKEVTIEFSRDVVHKFVLRGMRQRGRSGLLRSQHCV